MISEVLAGIPAIWPTVALIAAGAFLIRDVVAAPLRTSAGRAFVLLLAAGTIVAVTLTPASAVGGIGRSCDIRTSGFISLNDIAGLSDRALNVALFLPFGMALGVLPRSRAKALSIVLACAAPVLIELGQYAVIQLGRSCEANDVIDNLSGLALGILLAYLVSRVVATRAAHT